MPPSGPAWSPGAVAALDEVLRRYEHDAAFRALLDDEPAAALREYPLTPDELARLEDTIRGRSP